MDAWRDIRIKARECHRQALLKSKGVRKALVLLAAALDDEDLQLTPYAPGSVVSKGVYGFLDRPSKMINVASGQSPENEAVEGKGDRVITVRKADGSRTCYDGPCQYASARLLSKNRCEDAYGRVDVYWHGP